uniref:Uncharacterized protein n=1 Tax=Arundo donax TaxID=35708 RepID=A0A0A9FXJ5_ARUDO
MSKECMFNISLSDLDNKYELLAVSH